MSSPPRMLAQVGETLSMLADCVERFVNAWEVAPGPDPALFLPPDPVSRRLALCELIKVDLEYRWTGGHAPRKIEDYCTVFPELSAVNLPAEVLYEEYHLRRQAGDAISLNEYTARFPEQADALRRLIGLGTPYESTAIFSASGRSALKSVSVGQQLDEFDLLAELGAGAFARVFLARQNSMQRLVALKITANRGSEPQTLGRLDHESIVRVYDVRVLPETSLRLLYMQYLPGGTLQDVVRRVRQLSVHERDGRILLHAVDQSLDQRGETAPAESALRDRLQDAGWAETVCHLGAAIARALDVAHGKDTLHRDVKPANVLLTAEGAPKLADFNISFSSQVDGATPAAYFGGSLAYMSPEQLEVCHGVRSADSLDGRSDLYSLGVMLVELLTGRRPFPQDQVDGSWRTTVGQLIENRREQPPQIAAEELPSDCSPRLVSVLNKCLAPDRSNRWNSGRQLATQLEMCRSPELNRLFSRGAVLRGSWWGRYPLTIMVLMSAIPNIFAGVFNFHYNQSEIIDHLADAKDEFFAIQFVINSIAYPLGLGWGLLIAVPLVKAVRRIEAGEVLSGGELASMRALALSLGRKVASIAVLLWTFAGVAYPVSIHLAAGTMPAHAYAHFFFSLLICGMIASAYPFFGITLFSIAALYPALLAESESFREDAPLLQRIGAVSTRKLACAAAVPMLAVLALIVIDSTSRFALVIFSAGSIAGLAAALTASRNLQDKVTALLHVIRSTTP